MDKTEVKNDSQEVKTFFDGYASDFDSIYGHTDSRSFTDKLADKWFRKVMVLRFAETLKRSANPEIKSIVDVGCGPGHYCVEFLKQGKKVLALDLAENMLKIAKNHVKEQGLENKEIEYVYANYTDYDFKEKYDAACLMGFFDYIQKPEEIFEKLKKDINKEVYASFPKEGGFLAWQRKIRYKMRNCPLYLYTEEDVKNLMEKLGFNGKYEIVDFGRGLFVKVDMT